MSISTDINEMLLRDIFEAYQRAEETMLERIAKRTKRGVMDTGWTEEKFNDVQKLRREIEATLGDVNQLAKAKLSDGIIKAYKAGVASASKDMKKVESILNDFVPEHIQRMILETNNLIDNTSFQILRNTQDVYRAIISETSTQALLGVETRLETAQNALNMFAAKGITGFVDRAGRRWDLASYVEMATRTTTARAALQGHIDRQTEIGNDLVMVSSIGTTCPICAQWQGKVLSISGKTQGYSSLDSAKAAGLFHPNCKHTITAYFPEIDDYEPPVTKNNPEKYEATQKQRYNERQIRKWKRVEAAAMTPAAKAKAANMVKKWQGIQREHVMEWNLRRNYVRENPAKASKKPKLPKIEQKIEIPKQTQQIHYKDLEKNYDAITNFENKFDDIINNLSDKEKDAIMMYTQTGGAQQINDYLRSNGSTPIFDEYKEAIEYIDSAIEKSKIQDNIIVHRSVGYNFLGDELKNELFTMRENFDVKKIIGMEFEDKGFMSTSLNKTFSNSINIDIKVKKGTNGIAIEKLSIVSNEHEVLFGRNTKLKIVDASLEKSTGKINLIAELISKQMKNGR